jgi:hypothetical protein
MASDFSHVVELVAFARSREQSLSYFISTSMQLCTKFVQQPLCHLHTMYLRTPIRIGVQPKLQRTRKSECQETLSTKKKFLICLRERLDSYQN